MHEKNWNFCFKILYPLVNTILDCKTVQVKKLVLHLRLGKLSYKDFAVCKGENCNIFMAIFVTRSQFSSQTTSLEPPTPATTTVTALVPWSMQEAEKMDLYRRSCCCSTAWPTAGWVVISSASRPASPSCCHCC